MVLSGYTLYIFAAKGELSSNKVSEPARGFIDWALKTPGSRRSQANLCSSEHVLGARSCKASQPLEGNRFVSFLRIGPLVS